MTRFKDDIYVGSQFFNTIGEKASIVEVENARSVLIEWDDDAKNKSTTTITQLRSGHFKNPFTPSVWGTGFIGVGEYSPKVYRTAYLAWQGVMQRCFDKKLHEKFPSYSSKTLNKRWSCFQNFAPWFQTESVNMKGGESWAVDKDILRSNEYGPESCLVVPEEVNLLILSNKAKRGELPIGVSLRKETGKYRARCQVGEGQAKSLGNYDSVEEAFSVYKAYKERHIKFVAEKYKGIITDRAYQALMAYEVRIDD